MVPYCSAAPVVRRCCLSGDLLRSWERGGVGGVQPWEATVLGVANIFAFLRLCVG